MGLTNVQYNSAVCSASMYGPLFEAAAAQQCPVADRHDHMDDSMFEVIPQHQLGFVPIPPRQEKNVGLIIGELLEPVVRAFKEYVYVPVVDTSVSIAQKAWKLVPVLGRSEQQIESESKAQQVRSFLSQGDFFTAFEVAKTIPDITMKLQELRVIAGQLRPSPVLQTAEGIQLGRDLLYLFITELMTQLPDDNEKAITLLQFVKSQIRTNDDLRHAFQISGAIQSEDSKVVYLLGCAQLLIEQQGDVRLALEAAQELSKDESKQKYLMLYSYQLLEASDYRHAFEAIQRIPSSQLAGRQLGFMAFALYLDQHGEFEAAAAIRSKLEKDRGLRRFRGSFDDLIQNRV